MEFTVSSVDTILRQRHGGLHQPSVDGLTAVVMVSVTMKDFDVECGGVGEVFIDTRAVSATRIRAAAADECEVTHRLEANWRETSVNKC